MLRRVSALKLCGEHLIFCAIFSRCLPPFAGTAFAFQAHAPPVLSAGGTGFPGAPRVVVSGFRQRRHPHRSTWRQPPDSPEQPRAGRRRVARGRRRVRRQFRSAGEVRQRADRRAVRVRRSLPAPGQRMQPSHAPLLARLRSANTCRRFAPRPAPITGSCTISSSPPIRTATATSSRSVTARARRTPSRVPHDFVLSHLYVHGDRCSGRSAAWR